ncbi:VUT family protein [Lentzea sp. NPDC051213]|uniref:VUT family protein n=1 Tax=Lentzea sp. NPDC051213 TaxID=3364126 RepID=UPI0037B5E713
MTHTHSMASTASHGFRNRLAGAGRRLGWVGLVVATAYVSSVVMANWASTHWAALLLGPVTVPAGTLWAGVTFTLRDLLHESLGTRGVVTAITVGTGLSWVLATPQIAVASVVAFAVSETIDSAIYALLRGESPLQAVLGSNIAGLLVDSVLFVPLAFGSFTAVPGQLLGKAVATLLTVVVLWAVRRGRRAVS